METSLEFYVKENREQADEIERLRLENAALLAECNIARAFEKLLLFPEKELMPG